MTENEFSRLDAKVTRLLELSMQTREELAAIRPALAALGRQQNKLTSTVEEIEDKQTNCPARVREMMETKGTELVKRQWENRIMFGGFIIAVLATVPGWLALFMGCSMIDDDKAGAQPPMPQWSAELDAIESASLTWAERRFGAATNDPDFDASTGDAVLFDGLLCTVGVLESCEAVIASQSVDGRFWRSPQWVNQPYGSGSVFSRDMALGALAYGIATRDKPRMEAWGSWIRNHDYAVCPGDSNCKLVSPAIWSVFRHVFDKVGAARFGAMWAFDKGHETLQPLAETSAICSALHLIAFEVYLLRLAGVSKPTTSRTLSNRQPGNPFYAWLAGDTQRAYNLTRDLCPLERPAARQMWQWERPIPNERPELGSGGWDCVFMARLLRTH